MASNTTTPTLFNNGEQKSQLNQYWYSESTIKTLCEEIKLHGNKVAFLSTPSLYFAFPEEERKNFKLFEYDKKWESDPGFVFYDFNEPEKLPVSLWGSFDYLVVDPPFITKEVWEKYMMAVKTLGARTPAANGVAPQNAFKVLFTTVLENHIMLENLLDGALFIPDFRPTVTGLVYQYSCFVNYNHVRDAPSELFPEGRGVGKINKEVEAEDPKQAAARAHANDMRESEVEFIAQMRARKRDAGDEGAPLAAVQRRKNATGNAVDTNGNDDDQNASAATTMYDRPVLTDDTPIADMKWGHIPEGLQMYKDGAAAPPAATEEIPAEAYGPVYVNALKKRESLDVYKKLVEEAFKKLDSTIQATETAAAAANAENEEKQAAATKSKDDFKAHLDSILAIEQTYSKLCSESDAFPATKTSEGEKKKDASLMDMMKKCVAKLGDGSLMNFKAAKDFAIDATRLFKSPAFNRQKELLQTLKAEKKKYADEKAAAAAKQ